MNKIQLNGVNLSKDALETIRSFQEEDGMMVTELIRLLDDYIALRAWIGINTSEDSSVNYGSKSTLADIHSATVLKEMILKLK